MDMDQDTQKDFFAVCGTSYALCCVVIVHLVLMFLFNVHTSFFVYDDLHAIELAHTTDLLTSMTTRIDVHWVPLYRAVQYALHHTLPMNFAAATLFLLGCHALTLLVLYRLLQRLNARGINRWLVAFYAMNAFVLIPLHWWAAGLHRFPYVLLAVASCYSFVRFHQSGKISHAAGALLAAMLATGFFIKAVLVPLYWAAILFCIIDFRRWREYRRQYTLLSIGIVFAASYITVYLLNTPEGHVHMRYNRDALLLGLNWGISTTAQMPLQMPFHTGYSTVINISWGLLLAALCLRRPQAWRAVTALATLLLVNLGMIYASQRAEFFGSWAMLTPRYYFELLFLLVIFGSLLLRPVQARSSSNETETGTSLLRQHLPGFAAIAVLIIYGVAGWRAASHYLKPDSDDDFWQCARFERNLLQSLQNFDAGTSTLADTPVPDCFKYGKFTHRQLMLSKYLEWHDNSIALTPLNSASHVVDRQGNIVLNSNKATQ